MKTILVTGGTGFIGNCFCKLLLEERPEYRVINVDVCTYAATFGERLSAPTAVSISCGRPGRKRPGI